MLVVSILALVVAVRALLLPLGRPRLWGPVAPILLPLSLGVIGILAWTTLGGTVSLLLRGIALLSRVLLLRGVALLLWRALLVGFLLLTILCVTLLWGSVRWHWSLAHDMVALVDLPHHAHGVLLSLVMLPSATRGHIVLLGGGLLVHHRTLIWLHVHVGSRAIVAHGLSLCHVHLTLSGNALGGGDSVVVAAHRAVATGGHVHGATLHVGRLVRTRTRALHGHVIRTGHLSIHLVLHVRGRGATANHPLRWHVVTMRRLRRGATLVHPTRAHWHILSGRSWKQ